MNERIADAKYRAERHQRLLEERQELLIKQAAAHKVYEQYCERLEKEDADVAKLHALSLSNLIATLAQNKAERLEKEEQEALDALRDVKKQENELSVLQMQIDSLNHVIDELEHAEEELDQLFEMKKQLVDDSMIRSMEMEIEGLRLRQKEIKEAMDAGDVLLSHLRSAQKKLSSASSWGLYDMFGGGMIATAIKHDRISEAQENLQLIESDLRHFNKELHDVKLAQASDLQMDSFSMIGDYLFDNLFMDGMVQGKIRKMQDKVDASVDEVDRILQKLYRDQLTEQKRIDELETAIEERLSKL